MTITLPDDLKADLERRAAGHGLTVDEYVQFLVETEIEADGPTPRDLGYKSQEALEAHIQMSIDSGPPVIADDQFWAGLRREVAERAAARRQARP